MFPWRPCSARFFRSGALPSFLTSLFGLRLEPTSFGLRLAGGTGGGFVMRVPFVLIDNAYVGSRFQRECEMPAGGLCQPAGHSRRRLKLASRRQMAEARVWRRTSRWGPNRIASSEGRAFEAPG